MIGAGQADRKTRLLSYKQASSSSSSSRGKKEKNITPHQANSTFFEKFQSGNGSSIDDRSTTAIDNLASGK